MKSKWTVLMEQCELRRLHPEWLLAKFGVKPMNLLETRDQAFRRQRASLLWKIAECELGV